MVETSSLAVAELPPDAPATVLVVDDEPDLRLLLRLGLDHHEAFSVVAEARDGAEAIELAAAHQPDIVLLDLNMPGVDGRDALPQILLRSPRSMIVVLSALQAPVEAKAMLARGAFAFVEKGGLSDNVAADLILLLGEFRRALQGETVIAGRPAVELAREARDLNR